MKKETHPQYKQILFVDSSTGHKFVCGAAMDPKESDTFEGKEYPVCRVAISSASHPFFTGSKQFVDAEGRVDKFKKRYAAINEKMKRDSSKEEEETKGKAKKGSAKKKGKS